MTLQFNKKYVILEYMDNEVLIKFQKPKSKWQPTSIESRMKAKKRTRDWLNNLRKALIDILGGKCIKCGFTDSRALQIDHIFGGGSKERKTVKITYYKYIMNEILRESGKYQLLCANCNWIKRVENKEVRNPII